MSDSNPTGPEPTGDDVSAAQSKTASTGRKKTNRIGGKRTIVISKKAPSAFERWVWLALGALVGVVLWIMILNLGVLDTPSISEGLSEAFPVAGFLFLLWGLVKKIASKAEDFKKVKAKYSGLFAGLDDFLAAMAYGFAMMALAYSDAIYLSITAIAAVVVCGLVMWQRHAEGEKQPMGRIVALGVGGVLAVIAMVGLACGWITGPAEPEKPVTYTCTAAERALEVIG